MPKFRRDVVEEGRAVFNVHRNKLEFDDFVIVLITNCTFRSRYIICSTVKPFFKIRKRKIWAFCYRKSQWWNKNNFHTFSETTDTERHYVTFPQKLYWNANVYIHAFYTLLLFKYLWNKQITVFLLRVLAFPKTRP